MEFFKNTIFITTLWVVAGVILILLGAWREYLHRQDSDKKYETIIKQGKENNDLLKQSNENQKALIKAVIDLKDKGEISPESAEKIIQIILSDNISLKDDVKVERSPSPSRNSSNSEESRNDVLKENKKTLTDKLEIKVFRKEDKR